MRRALPILALLLASCDKSSPQSGSGADSPNDQVAVVNASGEAPAPPPPGSPGGLADDREPLSEGKLDLKGPEGAGQVVQQFAALMEQRRFAEARELWGGDVPNDSLPLLASLETYREVHAQIGKPSGMEGAAGSLYVTVPILLHEKDSSGAAFNMKANATLRRVNDVPGSTAEQRSWHLIGLARD